MAEHTTPTVGTSDDDFDRLIGDASLPERSVSLCLNGKLRREYEDVKERIEKRAAERDGQRTAAAAATLNEGDTRLATKAPEVSAVERDPEQDRLDQLVVLMRGQMVTFLVRAMPSKEYNRLLEQCPPRKESSTGRIDPRDYQGYDSSKFVPALVRKSIVQPTMTDERWAKLDDVLTDAQFDKLFQAAAEVNRRDEDIPF